MPDKNQTKTTEEKESGGFSKSLNELNKSGEDFGKAFGDLRKNTGELGGNAGALGGTVGAIASGALRKTSANAGGYDYAKTVIGRASKNTFEFPVFMSSSVPMDYATAVNSLLEQIYASYLQMAISMQPVISYREAENGPFDAMKTNVTKYLEYTTSEWAHDACENHIVTEASEAEFHMINITEKDAAIIQEALDYVPLSEFDHFFQEAGNYRRLREQQMRDEHDKAEREKQKDLRQKLKDKKDEEDRDAKRTRDEAEESRKEAKEKREVEKATREKAEESRKAAKEKRDIDQYERDKNSQAILDKQRVGQSNRDFEKHAMDMKVKAPQLMDETKIQKLNTMKPLMMTASLKIKDKNGAISNAVDYVVGVKTHCRVVPADILPDVVKYPQKEMNRLTHKAKWRAGEIKFLDYFFNRNAKKQAAYDSKDPNRRWYHRLYTLAHSKGSSALARKISGSKSPDGLIPNVTMVMTKADVDMIESETSIDLLKGSAARSFCKELFLICLIVLDTDAQSIKILLPDINNDYEVHSFASVNKQLATLDTAGDVSREVSKLMRGR